MKKGTIDIKKAYLGTKELTNANAFVGLVPLIDNITGEYLCITANDSSTVGLLQKSSYHSLEYSFNRRTWTTMTTSTSLSLNTGDKLYIRGKLTNNNSDSNYTNFSITGDVSLSGDIRYLWNYENLNAAWRNWCGYRLFSSCGGVKDIMNLTLCETDTILSENCFSYMFYDCSITTVPDLPAMDLAPYCYESMFNGCSGITIVPKLPATTLVEYCYSNMFANCNYLTTVTELPASTLVNSCYRNMFINCGRLNYIKCLAEENMNSTNCYNWVKNVASSGTFVKSASATTWTVDSTYGIPSGWTVLNDGYIQDGLLVFMDCLDTENCADNYWRDPIHNITFTGNSQYSERGFKFNGPNSGTYLLSNTTFMNNILSNMICTVEVVAESVDFTTWGFLFADGDWDNLELMISFDNSQSPANSCTWAYRPNSGIYWNTNGHRFSIPCTIESLKNKKFVISEAFGGRDTSLKQGFFNCQEMSFLNSKNADGTHRGDKMMIGARTAQRTPGQGTGTFAGYIKCVRLYSRQLTAEEILHNQAIDNKRYNLGLLTTGITKN